MPAFAPRFTISHPITTALTAIERARGFLEAALEAKGLIRHEGETNQLVYKPAQRL
jgi:hypothetical protein